MSRPAPRGEANLQRPDTHMQRTRSSPPAPHSPLMRKPLGAGKELCLAIVTICCLSAVACLGVPKPKLVATSGTLESLRGTSELAVYADSPYLAMLKKELAALDPGIVFTTADAAQVTITFQELLPTTICVDCDEEPKPGLFAVRWARASVAKENDPDRPLPRRLVADWEYQAYTRKALVQAFVRSFAPYLRGPGA
jgi:hypothetical protein